MSLRNLCHSPRHLLQPVAWLLVLTSLILAQSCSITQHLVIVNHSTSVLNVSYQPGAFNEPGTFLRVVMLERPLQAPAKRFKRLHRYAPMPDDSVNFEAGTGRIAFVLPPKVAAMIAGRWTPSVENRPIESALLTIVSPDGKQSYEVGAAISAFRPRSWSLRVLEVR